MILLPFAIGLAISQWWFVAWFDVRPEHRQLAIPIIGYATILIMMAGGLMFLSLSGVKPFYVMIGGGLFLASDFILQWKIFIRNSRLKSAAVMLTYTLAQLLIILGL